MEQAAENRCSRGRGRTSVLVSVTQSSCRGWLLCVWPAALSALKFGWRRDDHRDERAHG